MLRRTSRRANTHASVIVGSRSIGLDDTAYGTHTMRRTKASLIYRRTKNLRAVQLLLGHTKIESTVRYLGIEVDDALEMADRCDPKQVSCSMEAHRPIQSSAPFDPGG